MHPTIRALFFAFLFTGAGATAISAAEFEVTPYAIEKWSKSYSNVLEDYARAIDAALRDNTQANRNHARLCYVACLLKQSELSLRGEYDDPVKRDLEKAFAKWVGFQEGVLRVPARGMLTFLEQDVDEIAQRRVAEYDRWRGVVCRDNWQAWQLDLAIDAYHRATTTEPNVHRSVERVWQNFHDALLMASQRD